MTVTSSGAFTVYWNCAFFNQFYHFGLFFSWRCWGLFRGWWSFNCSLFAFGHRGSFFSGCSCGGFCWRGPFFGLGCWLGFGRGCSYLFSSTRCSLCLLSGGWSCLGSWLTTFGCLVRSRHSINIRMVYHQYKKNVGSNSNKSHSTKWSFPQ